MKRLLTISLAVTCVACGSTPPPAQDAQVNRLTEQERDGGWRLLFDGATMSGWRGYQLDRVPAGWEVADGAIAFTPGVEGGDIITNEQFANFELSLEWKISPNGNSGIFYRASEDAEGTWRTAPEMQVLDNAGHVDGQNPLTSAGANYGLYAPVSDVTRPIGSWNEVRIVINASHVEHWLNGSKVVEYELWTDAWRELVKSTKFVETPGYGLNRVGHIGLQDHGDPVWYRNLKIRPLSDG